MRFLLLCLLLTSMGCYADDVVFKITYTFDKDNTFKQNIRYDIEISKLDVKYQDGKWSRKLFSHEKKLDFSFNPMYNRRDDDIDSIKEYIKEREK